MTTKYEVETKVDHNYHQLQGDKTSRWESALPPEYWEYRRKWQEYPQNHVVEKFPVHLDIEATSNCNLLCTMCPRTDMINDGTFWKVKNFDFELYARLVDEGAEKGLCSIKFNYLGEPLMNPRLAEMIRYAKDKGIVDVMFNTNASMLTERLAKQLIESGLDKLFFSFDSPYRDHYNQIRINADYDKVLRNIKRFMQIRDEMGSPKPFTRVSMVRMKENDEEWQAFKELFEPIVDAVAYVDYLDHNNQADTGKMLVKITELGEKKFCCPQLWQRMFVHPDGVVTVCCVDSARKLSVGRIDNKTVEEIWNGPEYQKLRDLHAAGRIDEIPICAKCPLALAP
ncbi:MAG: radical SAM protein [Candidatus Omnitrophota bacterium]|jgi:radical SAM protein with 4Fe4S-binding SPASM domain|nr:MAG: radical SAM protein [Candidatus Omnitrophota bacterium]